jgi:hypothetical protein
MRAGPRRLTIHSVRWFIALTAIALVAAGCNSGPRSASLPAPTPNGARITRPSGLQMWDGDAPVLLRAVPGAGTFVLPYRGGWRYDGRAGTLVPAPAPAEPLEHPAPAGRLTAIERQSLTPVGYAFSNELAVRDQTGGLVRVIYRAPTMFYWLGWSPDGRFIALWEIDQYSGSIDQDGRPLVIVDVATGARVDLGRTLLFGTTAWKAPHTLAFVRGTFRMLWDNKSLELWSPEDGVRQVSPSSTAGFAPVWSANGGSLYFASGPAGQYIPLPVIAGRGVGDRVISVYQVASGTLLSLAQEPGYVDEGARPSRDGTRLLVLRRKAVEVTDLSTFPGVDLEIWLTDANGAHGTALMRFPKSFGAYGWLPDPTDWEWSE